MTSRVLPLHGSEHAVADALLPWYVNGTLRGEELVPGTSIMWPCELCRREVDWLREVFAACFALAPLPDAAENAAAITLPPLQDEIRRVGGGRGWRQAGRSTEPWVRGLMAAQLGALAILGTLLAVETRTRIRGIARWARRRALLPPATPSPSCSTRRSQKPSCGTPSRRPAAGSSTGRATNAFIVEVPSAGSAGAVQRLREEPKVPFAEPLGARTER